LKENARDIASDIYDFLKTDKPDVTNTLLTLMVMMVHRGGVHRAYYVRALPRLAR